MLLHLHGYKKMLVASHEGIKHLKHSAPRALHGTQVLGLKVPLHPSSGLFLPQQSLPPTLLIFVGPLNSWRESCRQSFTCPPLLFGHLLVFFELETSVRLLHRRAEPLHRLRAQRRQPRRPKDSRSPPTRGSGCHEFHQEIPVRCAAVLREWRRL